jgi:hypothetical protein
MLDERTEALLLDALSTASGGAAVKVDKGARATAFYVDGLGVLAGDSDDLAGLAALDVERRATTGDLTVDDALLAVQVIDNYLHLAVEMQQLPGTVAMGDLTWRKIKDVRAKIAGMIG